jgi:integrase/recombinase XerD
MNFEQYLIKSEYSESTIKRYLSWEREFLRYFVGFRVQELDYNQLLSYVVEKETKGLTRSTLIHILARIERYYQYLQLPNPIEGFKLKGYNREQERRYLDADDLYQLEKLCERLDHWPTWQRLALSFLIYQGLALRELPRLQVLHMDVERYRMRSPSGSLAKRELELSTIQVLLLGDHLDLRRGQEWLFKELEVKQVQWRFHQLKQRLKIELANNKVPIPFENFQQLRASRIRRWIDRRGILTAQYLAGHYHLISTQIYQLDYNEGLREAFQEIHPMF